MKKYYIIISDEGIYQQTVPHFDREKDNLVLSAMLFLSQDAALAYIEEYKDNVYKELAGVKWITIQPIWLRDGI